MASSVLWIAQRKGARRVTYGDKYTEKSVGDAESRWYKGVMFLIQKGQKEAEEGIGGTQMSCLYAKSSEYVE